MKVDIALSKPVIGKKSYYIVINDTFYVKIKKSLFYELARFLKIDV